MSAPDTWTLRLTDAEVVAIRDVLRARMCTDDALGSCDDSMLRGPERTLADKVWARGVDPIDPEYLRDCCSECHDMARSYRPLSVDGDFSFGLRYRCESGHSWKTWWSEGRARGLR